MASPMMFCHIAAEIVPQRLFVEMNLTQMASSDVGNNTSNVDLKQDGESHAACLKTVADSEISGISILLKGGRCGYNRGDLQGVGHMATVPVPDL
jgi:hypothetical protein